MTGAGPAMHNTTVHGFGPFGPSPNPLQIDSPPRWGGFCLSWGCSGFVHGATVKCHAGARVCRMLRVGFGELPCLGVAWAKAGGHVALYRCRYTSQHNTLLVKRNLASRIGFISPAVPHQLKKEGQFLWMQRWQPLVQKRSKSL
jgi:hypothetical protein